MNVDGAAPACFAFTCSLWCASPADGGGHVKAQLAHDLTRRLLGLSPEDVLARLNAGGDEKKAVRKVLRHCADQLTGTVCRVAIVKGDVHILSQVRPGPVG